VGLQKVYLEDRARSAATNTAPEAFYDNTFTDEMKKTGFLRELWK
jgi:hypothetical protein